MIVPDKIAPEKGWRVWRPWLSSISGPTRTNPRMWVPRERFVARCEPHVYPDGSHSAPDERCSCGVHAAKTLDELRDNFLAPIMSGYGIFGEVSLWGKVIEGEWGFRAEFAYPRSFYIPLTLKPEVEDGDPFARHWLDALESSLREFGVPVFRVDSIHDLFDLEDLAA